MQSVFLLILALLGAPLFAVIAAGALLGFYSVDIDLAVVPIEIYRIADTPVLLAIPLFTFTGYVLSESQASHRLVRLTDALLNWMPAGLSIVALVACAAFTALTGASGVTIIALGALLYPALREAGYADHFTLGLITSSGSLGLLFPPSIALILYGIIVQQMNIGPAISINDLFRAGLLPGLLMVFLLSGWCIWANRNTRLAKSSLCWRTVYASLRESIWELLLPIIILGGIYSGIFAISEAAAVSVLYILIVEMLIHREISLTHLPGIMRDSMVLVGGVLIILAVSLASTNYLVDAEIPAKLFTFLKANIDSKLTFLILLNVFLLLLGMLLDIFSALVIMIPLILPIAIDYGIHPVHLGIIFLANMQIGYFTPPVGMNLFIASYRFDKPILDLYLATLPFMLILLLAVLIITYWPALSLALL
ncbi:MAG: TRAP transporter large permease subunit [Methyloprofundus sp.]|nr:TRAP transporter large permease subunit [Methyloprofundus sp.]